MNERLDDAATGFEDFYDDEIDTVEPIDDRTMCPECDGTGRDYVMDGSMIVHPKACDKCNGVGWIQASEVDE